MIKTMIKKALAMGVFICAFAKMYASESESHMLLDSPYTGHKVEIVMHTPSNDGAPLLLFLHGASSGEGANGISKSWFNYWLEKGYAVASISIPGYGESTGRKDFCGPFTMRSLNFAIDFIKNKILVSDFGIISFGQGSLASILLASQRSDVLCVVSANGGYDLLRHKAPGDVLMNTIQEKGYDLDINDDNALAERSAILHISTINTPVYLLHRRGNPFVTEEEVIAFHDKMLRAEKECYLTFKEKREVDAQKISYDEVLAETEDWVDSKMQQSE